MKNLPDELKNADTLEKFKKTSENTFLRTFFINNDIFFFTNLR